jgi:hypothetical protein
MGLWATAKMPQEKQCLFTTEERLGPLLAFTQTESEAAALVAYN